MTWILALLLFAAPVHAEIFLNVLTWDDNAVNEDAYLIERDKPHSKGIWSLHDEPSMLPRNTTAWVQRTGNPEVICYRVRALNLAGISGRSNTVCTDGATRPAPDTPLRRGVPVAPSNLRVWKLKMKGNAAW